MLLINYSVGLSRTRQAYSACGIVPLHSKPVIDKLQAPKTLPAVPLTLERTLHTKSELRQQTAWALNFVKTATEAEICRLILRFSHTAEFALAETDIVTHDMTRLRSQIKLAKPHKKDMRQLKGGRVLTGEQIRDGITERNKKPPPKQSNSKRTPQSTHQSIPVTPKRVGVRFRLSPRPDTNDTPPSASEVSVSSFHSQQPRHTPLPRLEPRLNTTQNPNRRLPDPPLGMSLRTRSSRTAE